VTAAECRSCHRPIRDAVAHDGLGPKCFRKHLAALGLVVKTLGRGRRNWNPDMPGQEELDLQETA